MSWDGTRRNENAVTYTIDSEAFYGSDRESVGSFLEFVS